MPFLRPDPQTTNWDEINTVLTTEIAPLWSGQKSPSEVAMAVKRGALIVWVGTGETAVREDDPAPE